MKFLLSTFIVLLFLNSKFSAQINPLTNSADNGYAWISLSQPVNKLKDYKQNYLISILDNQKLKKLSGQKISYLFNCDKEITELSQSSVSSQTDLDVIIRMLDVFYSTEENLIIPVLGAYCYCIKNLSGLSKEELENYRQELLKFSKE
ncbi:MAG: hypothetical protein RBR74_06410 [Ignavibacteriaceae bacterium]|jgi:hypothetical protein|nr:hypothetical protein [Ignavibacteriaceae bacterium]